MWRIDASIAVHNVPQMNVNAVPKWAQSLYGETRTCPWRSGFFSLSEWNFRVKYFVYWSIVIINEFYIACPNAILGQNMVISNSLKAIFIDIQFISILTFKVIFERMKILKNSTHLLHFSWLNDYNDEKYDIWIYDNNYSLKRGQSYPYG